MNGVNQESISQPEIFKYKTQRLLVVGIFLVAVFSGMGGYILGRRVNPNGQSVSLPTPSLASSASSLSVSPTLEQNNILKAGADTVVQEYYNWYLTCQQHVNTANAFHGETLNPKQECAYNKTGALTDNLVHELQQVVAFDPVLYAQNIPQKVTYEKVAEATNGTASVIVHTLWGASASQNIHVELGEINNQWRIIAINCNQ